MGFGRLPPPPAQALPGRVEREREAKAGWMTSSPTIFITTGNCHGEGEVGGY